MRQLSGLDTTFFNMETPTTHGHVGGFALYDTSTMRGDSFFDSWRKNTLERLHLVPQQRLKIVEVPFGLDFPYWVEDPDFDIDYHLRHIAVPAPGTMEQLSELVCRLHSRPLDKTRPLWEAYVIEGVEGGLVAVYTKMHHAGVDGVSGASMATVIMDTTPEGRPIPPPPPPPPAEPIPTEFDMLTRGIVALVGQPFRAAQWGYRAARALPLGDMLPSVRDLRRWALGPAEGEVIEKPEDPAPKTPFNAPISAHRRFAFGKVSLADVKTVKNHFGTTLNDVVMSLCAGMLRRWLIDHDALPDTPLYAGVPISIRKPDQMTEMGNQVSMLIAGIGTHIEDPVERLRFCQEKMQGLKEQHGAMPAEIMTEATGILPPGVMALASRLASRFRMTDYVNLPMNVVISNVPGPRVPLYAAGARQVASYPMSIVVDGGGLNLTVASYEDDLFYGFLACRELVPDVWNLAGYFEEALAELLALTVSGTKSAAKPKKKAAPTARPKSKPKAPPARSRRKAPA